MRRWFSVGLAMGATACSWIESPPLDRAAIVPPPETVFQQGVATAFAGAKLTGIPEVSALRRAPLIAPADWMACLRSTAQATPPYAIFFDSKALVHYRIAVLIDNCDRESYAPVKK
jgi:hypothetical protein